jgi:hypothetical protein
LKPRHVRALHHVHRREASLSQTLCRERPECFSCLLPVIMWYSCQRDKHSEAMSFDERFSFNLLPFLISNSSSSATVNSAELVWATIYSLSSSNLHFLIMNFSMSNKP